MKKVLCLFLLSAIFSCSDILDLEPKNKITADNLYSTSEGVRAAMANLYGRLPIEDFNYGPNRGFNVGIDSDLNNAGFYSPLFCDEAFHSEFNDFGEEWFDYWGSGYQLIHDINVLIGQVPNVTSIEESEKNSILAEAYFLRAFTYFSLAKRYGGLSIIDAAQDYNGDIEALKVPRSTEKRTWDFILEDCDRAISMFGDANDGEVLRANRWTALALKSRAALFAASIAKYSHEPYVSFSGPAVEQELVGIPASEADYYYEICISSSNEIINSGKYALYRPNPSTPEEATANYQKLFEKPYDCLDGAKEPIFMRGYASDTRATHNFNIWCGSPQIITDPNLFAGRVNPSLDFVDAFEDYTDDGRGLTKPIKTRVDGNEDDYDGFSLSKEYLTFPMDKPYEAFKGRDARLYATIFFPGDKNGSTKLVIQGGMIKADGSDFYYRTEASEIGLDGNTYYTYGGSDPSQYSGFDTHRGQNTRSGFLLKKFMQIETPMPEYGWQKCTNPWIEIRLGEVMLNLAEAIAEKSNATSEEKLVGKQALNAIRHRAAHRDDIELTVANVRKERFIELAFENKRRWDLIRWRTFHTEFENRIRKGLVPFLDLRKNPPCYVFVRVNPLGLTPQTFNYLWYYKDIPGINSNGLIQNP